MLDFTEFWVLPDTDSKHPNTPLQWYKLQSGHLLVQFVWKEKWPEARGYTAHYLNSVAG